MKIKFEVEDVVPRAKERPRFTRTGFAYTPKGTREYEQIIRDEYMVAAKKNEWEVFEKPCKMMIKFEIVHRKQVDLDNLTKAVTDALNKVAYIDDSLIHELHLYKHIKAEVNRITIEIEDLGVT